MKTVVKSVAVFILMSLLVVVACKPKPAPTPGEPGPGTVSPGTPQGTVIAKIGDHTITWEEFTETYRIDPKRGMNAETLERLLDNYINQYLVYLDGLEKGYDKKPEIVAQVQRTERQLISRYVIKDLNQRREEPSEEQMQAYYQENPDNFSTTLINYVIFYNRKYDNDPAKSRAAAEKALKGLKGGQEFSKVAEEIYGRAAPNTEMRIKKNQKTYYGPKFDEAVWKIEEGKFSDIIETGQGFLVFKVIKREKLDYEQAKIYIKSELTQGSGMNRLELFYSELRKKYPVTVEKDVLQSKVRNVAAPPQPGRPPTPPAPPPHP